MPDFDEVITDIGRLHELMPLDSSTNTAQKVTDHLTAVARRFISHSPFVVLATKAADGLIDVSPKGDPMGFVEVLDDHTIAIPDRLGNHRVDGFHNILTDPNVAILFVVPGHGDTLRVAGKAKIVRDRSLSALFAVNGREPELVLVVEVEEAFMHCSKAFIRSRLWHPETWPERKSAPTLADWVIDAVDKKQTLDDVQAIHTDDEEKRLY